MLRALCFIWSTIVNANACGILMHMMLTWCGRQDMWRSAKYTNFNQFQIWSSMGKVTRLCFFFASPKRNRQLNIPYQLVVQCLWIVSSVGFCCDCSRNDVKKTTRFLATEFVCDFSTFYSRAIQETKSFTFTYITYFLIHECVRHVKFVRSFFFFGI